MVKTAQTQTQTQTQTIGLGSSNVAQLSATSELNIKPLDNEGVFSEQVTLCGISVESIRNKAYFLWEEAGCPEGDGVNFWIAAEQWCKGK